MCHRSRKSYVTHPQECFDEGDRRSVLVYPLGIECVNLKSAPPTTQRKVVVWVKTLRDLQALKKLWIGPESLLSFADASVYPFSPSPIHVPILVISKYRIKLTVSKIFRWKNKLYSACLLHINNNSYAINL